MCNWKYLSFLSFQQHDCWNHDGAVKSLLWKNPIEGSAVLESQLLGFQVLTIYLDLQVYLE